MIKRIICFFKGHKDVRIGEPTASYTICARCGRKKAIWWGHPYE